MTTGDTASTQPPGPARSPQPEPAAPSGYHYAAQPALPTPGQPGYGWAGPRPPFSPPGYSAQVGPPQPGWYDPYQWDPYQPGPWGAQPPQPERRRSVRWRRWVVGVLTVLLVCSVGGAGGLAGLATYVGAFDRNATWAAGPGSARSAPATNAPAAMWRAWARAAAEDGARAQAKAMLDGDEAGYLAVVDPAEESLVNELRRQFTVLRAMGIGAWRQTITSAPQTSGTRRWRFDLTIHYCFGPSSCETVRLEVRTEWAYKNDRLLLTELGDSDETWNGPRPWEVVDLRVAAGRRAVVAATRVNAWRLPEAIKAADAAAASADRFAKWHERPGRYVVFLAGPTDWNKWYGREQPDWAAAWAVPVGTFTTEVVVRTEVVRQSGLAGLLAHELTHVTTLAGERDGADSSAWWLIEGIAEYAQFLGKPVRQYDAWAPLRSFVRGPWDGDVAVSAPASSSTLQEASGRYGVSFLAVRRIANKYGEAKMLEFFGRVVHSGESLDVAARGALGAPWSTVQADCARFVRNSVA